MVLLYHSLIAHGLLKVLEGVGGRSRWTSWILDATGGNASGASPGVLVSPMMTRVPITPAIVGLGGLEAVSMGSLAWREDDLLCPA